MDKVAVISTDTLMGIVAMTPKVIYDLKKRSHRKKLIRFVNKIDQLGNDLPEDLVALLKEFWPGSLTVVYKKNAYRMPRDPNILNLIKFTGPLYSSSANLSGKETPHNFLGVADHFRDDIYRLIFVERDQRVIPSKIASTIYDYDRKRIIRQGEIDSVIISKYVDVTNLY